MRLVPVSGEELIKILYKRGFVIKRRKGSHVQLEMPKEEE
ncbi:MAG: type II toxin-antitoxin system HicA family toxin [Thermoproteota archaeon]|nr:type II toxin-antitoxin system HicA family toxin [Candidatus Brockarchaeota archaeon]